MTWTVKKAGADVAHAAPPSVSVADNGDIEVGVGAYTVVIGKDIAPLLEATVKFCKECEVASNLALNRPSAGS